MFWCILKLTKGQTQIVGMLDLASMRYWNTHILQFKLEIFYPGDAPAFQAGYHPRKRTFKTHLFQV